MPKVSEEYKKQRKKLILDSAEACFQEKGFRDTSIDDIAKHSKTSKGTVYIYFKSKEDIYYELIEEKFTGTFQHLRDIVKTLNSSETKLRYIFDQYKKIEQTEEERKFIILQIETNLYLLRNGKYEDVMFDRLDREISFIQDIIDEGIRNGEFREDVDTKLLSMMLSSFQDGLVARAASKKTSIYHKPSWDLFEKLLFSYLKI